MGVGTRYADKTLTEALTLMSEHRSAAAVQHVENMTTIQKAQEYSQNKPHSAADDDVSCKIIPQ